MGLLHAPIGSLRSPLPEAFPVMAGKGDRVSGGRGTKAGLLHENFRFVQQPH